jgi:hypothetical protein
MFIRFSLAGSVLLVHLPNAGGEPRPMAAAT